MSDPQPLPDDAGSTALWPGDTGTLRDNSRRALLELLKGPYLSGVQRPQLWAALMVDERAIRARLHELFLDLVIDPIDEFAFTKKAETGEFSAPSALRRESLTFIDTSMLLVLRQILLTARTEQRVIIGREEINERLAVYRTGDEATFLKNLNGAWSRMHEKFRVLHKVDDERSEISPVVKFVIDERQVRALTETYAALAVSEEQDASA